MRSSNTFFFNMTSASTPLLLIFVLISLEPARATFEITRFVVPDVAVRNAGTTVLQCEYTLTREEKPLFSASWYKGADEFYRVQNQNGKNVTKAFDHVTGVRVQKDQSTFNRVVLSNVTLESSGTYKCELSQESSFRTISKEANLTVIVPPANNKPTFINITKYYSMGETLRGNCSAINTSPPAQLHVFINDVKVNPSYLTYYPLSEDQEPSSKTAGLTNSTVGIQFGVNNKYFFRGVIRLKCVAGLLGGKVSYQNEISLQHKNLNNGGHKAFKGALNSSTGFPVPTTLIVTTNLMMSMLWIGFLINWTTR